MTRNRKRVPQQEPPKPVATFDELLDLLRKTFPNSLPKEVVTQEQLGIMIGQQRVIDFIASHLNK